MNRLSLLKSVYCCNPSPSLIILWHLSHSSGVRWWKDLFREDPRSLGGVGHLCRRAEDQGPIQGQRHPRQQRDAHELAVHPFPSTGAHHAPWARLFHSSIQQGQVWLFPYRRQGDVLPSFHSQQNSKDVLTVPALSYLLCNLHMETLPWHWDHAVLCAGWLT